MGRERVAPAGRARGFGGVGGGSVGWTMVGTCFPSGGQKVHGKRGRGPACRDLFARSDGASERSERASPRSSIIAAY